MNGTTKIEFEIGGKPMFFETGVLAKQADAAVSCGLGDNIVFSAVTSAKEAKEGCDFFPLQVEYREKFYMFHQCVYHVQNIMITALSCN